MTSLESIVLPLAESRALAEKGIVLDTVLAWKWNPLADAAIIVMRDKGAREQYQLPAPTLSELLDAIRANVNPTSIFFNEIDQMIVQWIEPGNAVPLQERTAHRQTDLLAAASLLLEVAK